MSQRRALLKARNICPSCFHDASASPQGMCLSQKGQAGPKGPLPQGCPSGLTPLHSKTLGGKEKNKNKNKRRRRERGTTLFRIGDQNQLHAHPTASTGVWRRAAPVPPTDRAGVPVGHGSGAGVRASRCEAGGRAGPRSRGRRRPGRGGSGPRAVATGSRSRGPRRRGNARWPQGRPCPPRRAAGMLPFGAEPARQHTGGGRKRGVVLPQWQSHGSGGKAQPLLWVAVVFWWDGG